MKKSQVQPIVDVIKAMDWPLLAKQKHWLLKQRGKEVEGLLGLIDSLQDVAEEMGLADENSLYPRAMLVRFDVTVRVTGVFPSNNAIVNQALLKLKALPYGDLRENIIDIEPDEEMPFGELETDQI